MKKIIAFILFAALTLGLLSCAQKETEQIPEYNDFEATEFDLEGYECVIVQSFDEAHPFQYPEGTLLADLYLKRLKDISNDWNCEISIDCVTVGGYLDSTIPFIAAGTHIGEIACTTTPYNLVKAGVLYPLDVLKDHLDYTNSEKFGSFGLLEHGMKDGIPYTVSPVAWPGKQASYSYNIFAVNEGLIKRYGKVDPRDYVENGEWTWDNFEKVLPDYQIDDGTVKATAMNATWSFTLDMAMMNGADYVKRNSDGTLSPAFDSVNVAEAFDWCAKLFTEKADYITFDGHYDMVEGFINDEIVLANTSLTHMINEIIYESEDYGIVPFPCGPRGTYGVWKSAVNSFDCMGIYVNAMYPEAAAKIIDRMFEPFEGYETKEDIEQYASTIFYDKRDVEYFTTYLENVRWDYWIVGIYDYFSNAKDSVKRGVGSAEIISRYSEAVNNLIEEYVIPNAEFIQKSESAK